MIIKYKTGNYEYKNNEIEIDDTKNCFLKGTNPYDGLDTFLGIWINNNKLIIAELISYRTISYQCWLSTSLYTESEIIKFCEHSKNVKIILKDDFKLELDRAKAILDM